MFAILAAVCFLLVVLGVAAAIDLIALGLLFLAVHLIWPFTPWTGWARTAPPNRR